VIIRAGPGGVIACVAKRQRDARRTQQRGIPCQPAPFGLRII
jgi:hypothetical protein